MEEDEEEEEQEDQESEDAISETSIVASKRRKNVDVNSLLRSKKLSKESEELKTSNKKASRERHQPRKDSEIVRSAKEMKENKKRKEDFEEDYEAPVIAKSKSRKIEKKELEETGILTDNATKKSKLKKMEVEETDAVFEEDKKQSSHVKTKKNRKKEKTSLKTATKADEKSDKNHAKQKDKKSKQKNAELKNGELKSQMNSKEIEIESALESKHTHTSKKLSAFIGNKDVDSLDSLKDKISDRKREEKLKNEKEKQRKAMKSDTQSVHSKKVPSNSNAFHENDKDSAKRSKSKKGAKEDKAIDDTIKKQDTEIGENKKAHAKHTKGLGAEENATIQALNEATEKTLHVSFFNLMYTNFIFQISY